MTFKTNPLTKPLMFKMFSPSTDLRLHDAKKFILQWGMLLLLLVKCILGLSDVCLFVCHTKLYIRNPVKVYICWHFTDTHSKDFFKAFFKKVSRWLMGIFSRLFWQRECLRNIMKDLVFYEAAIKSYIKSPLRSPQEEVPPLEQILEIIGSLKVCLLCMCGRGLKNTIKTETETETEPWFKDRNS